MTPLTRADAVAAEAAGEAGGDAVAAEAGAEVPIAGA